MHSKGFEMVSFLAQESDGLIQKNDLPCGRYELRCLSHWCQLDGASCSLAYNHGIHPCLIVLETVTHSSKATRELCVGTDDT
jgi:hypothetical protein